MTRPARILVWTLATLLTLLAILVVVIATFDWNRVKPLLNERFPRPCTGPSQSTATWPFTGGLSLKRAAGVPGYHGRISPPRT